MRTVTTAVRVRKNGTSAANFTGRTPKNLPDVHTDELVLKVPPMPEELEKLPKAQKLWTDFCRTLIHRGKLKYNHLLVVMNAVKFHCLAYASNDLLCELGYIHYATDGRIVPPLYQVQKTFHDNFMKAYQALTLDPKTEMYDCLTAQTGGKSGCATVEMDQYDDF